MTTNTEVIQPYPYQEECLDAIKTAILTGSIAGLVVMASGLGKTITAALFVKQHMAENRESRCLFLCHQNDLLEQAQREFVRVWGSDMMTSYQFGFFHGEEKTAHKAHIVFASLQTMREHLDEFDPKEFDIVIVDESHHSKAETYEKAIRHFQPDFLLGITATPDRMDGNDIREIYGKEIYNLSLVDALSQSLLSPVEYKIMTDEISLSTELDTPHGRLSIKALNRIVFVPKRDKEIADIIMKHMAEIATPQVMIFCSSIDHCNHMASVIPGAVPIHSDLPSGERRTRLELFRQGVFQIAVTVDMFNEGLDIPEANLIVFLRSTDSMTIYYQQLARGLRPHKDKSKVTVLDFVANCERINNAYKLWQEVQDQIKDRRGPCETGGERDNTVTIPPFSLNVDKVEFKEKIIPLLDLIERIKAGFYPIWQEASEASQKLGIKIVAEYREKYILDPRLPCKPYDVYKDFPGFEVFLRGEKLMTRDIYSTWQEAGIAAKNLGIKTVGQYQKERMYKKDPMLPSAPDNVYSDFPGWKSFFKAERYYATWQEASESTLKLGIKNITEYTRDKKYKLDPRLPRSPSNYYSDFPGFYKFFSNSEPKNYYPTCKEASEAAIRLGLSSSGEYLGKNKGGKKTYKLDPRLPSSPEAYYEDFPGWPKFLGKE